MLRRNRIMFVWGVTITTLVSATVAARADDMLFAYSGPETLICPPEGYKPKSKRTTCPKLTRNNVHQWIGAKKLTLRLPASKLTPSESTDVQSIRLPSSAVAYLRRYSLNEVSQLDASRRSAVVLVVQWSVKDERTFGVQRSKGGGDAPKTYVRRVSPAKENYYHANIEDLNPESGVTWSIRSNSRVYRVQFIPGS